MGPERFSDPQRLSLDSSWDTCREPLQPPLEPNDGNAGEAVRMESGLVTRPPVSGLPSAPPPRCDRPHTVKAGTHSDVRRSIG